MSRDRFDWVTAVLVFAIVYPLLAVYAVVDGVRWLGRWGRAQLERAIREVGYPS